MSAACTFWVNRLNEGSGMYSCPDCARDLKSKLSKSAKNPDRVFVSCSKDFGGCGLFSFIDEEPRFMNKSNKKRPRNENTQVIGPLANNPSAHEERLGELVAEVAELRNQVAKLSDQGKEILGYIKEVTDN